MSDTDEQIEPNIILHSTERLAINPLLTNKGSVIMGIDNSNDNKLNGVIIDTPIPQIENKFHINNEQLKRIGIAFISFRSTHS